MRKNKLNQITERFFLSDQSAVLRYQDESLNKFYYKSVSDDSWPSGNAQCQAMGGQLPNIRSTGKQKFLTATFPNIKFWLGLTTNTLRFFCFIKPFDIITVLVINL